MLNLKSAVSLAAVSAVAGGGMLLATPAFAYQSASSNVEVLIDKRDLQTDDGVERVWNQLERKAKHSCEADGMKSISLRKAEDVCVVNLLDSFINNVGHKSLTSYHLAHREK